jgi:micrococcal nuclease
MMKNKIQLKVLIGILIIVVVSLFYYTFRNPEPPQPPINYPDNYVTNVVDGDTFDIYAGERVRILCVDTPETGEEGYTEATEFLESLILNKEVRLEKDVSETDQYGRLLRYVYVNKTEGEEIFVNKEIVRQGHGGVYRYGDDVKRCDEIEDNKN